MACLAGEGLVADGFRQPDFPGLRFPFEFSANGLPVESFLLGLVQHLPSLAYDGQAFTQCFLTLLS